MSIDRKYEQEFFKVLECLNEVDAIESVIIIGSWAEYLYSKTGVLDNFYPSLQTQDVDFLIPDIRKPSHQAHLASKLKEKGFTYDEDRVDNVSQIFGEDKFEVEFLTPKKGDGLRPLGKLNIGVKPQQLSHMSMLVDYSSTVTYNGYRVRIPDPEAYIIHKMIIHFDRTPLKKKRDLGKIDYLLPFVESEKLISIYYSLTKKEKGLVNKFISVYKDRVDALTILTDIIESNNVNNTKLDSDDYIKSAEHNGYIPDVYYEGYRAEAYSSELVIYNSDDKEIESITDPDVIDKINNEDDLQDYLEDYVDKLNRDYDGPCL